ncbi:hypothetical protein BURMUCGD2M_5472 [Burkholderia multivorans CGD2M]|uniref:Uncharacterized protein n=1 Tax=Burkholderia multivorans CGD2 TaxID=513052 RepID=B9BK72_9BURK|nr:hypothetical protein BURMUCGD2_5481 [Burkholderia multivorans CGD2]EEE16026.1 hypothetical protein BURMUCGD2M_5472 [Burkholderia multivorans CGD2M]
MRAACPSSLNAGRRADDGAARARARARAVVAAMAPETTAHGARRFERQRH